MDLWLESFRVAFLTLRGNRLRTILTALTVSLGAGAISLMVSLAKSGIATITTTIDEVGGRQLVFVSPREPKVNKRTSDRRLTQADADALRAHVPGLADVAYLMSMRNLAILGDGKKADVDLAIGSSYRRFINQPLIAGVDIPSDTEKSSARVVVLVDKVATQLFGSAAAAVGKAVTLWGHRYIVVGVAGQSDSHGFNMGGVSRDRIAYVSAPVVLKDEGVLPLGYMVLRDDGTTSHDLQIRIANAVLLQRHGGVDDFEFFDLEALLVKFDKIFLGLRVIIGLIAAVSLFIAGAGVMNVLLASVRQRVSEIGIRRALGASEADIRRQFLVESVALAGIGGVVGSLGGIATAALAGLVVPKFVPGWQGRIAFDAGVIAIVMATVAGVVFGVAPARRASRLDVIDCLRGGGGA